MPPVKLRTEMEAFYRTHAYLVEHTNAPVRRDLMDEIDWSDRLIGIKGTRGVGKTTFLLQYAKEKFGTDRSCLFINMNNFYFSGHSIVDFANEFQKTRWKSTTHRPSIQAPGMEQGVTYVLRPLSQSEDSLYRFVRDAAEGRKP